MSRCLKFWHKNQSCYKMEREFLFVCRGIELTYVFYKFMQVDQSTWQANIPLTSLSEFSRQRPSAAAEPAVWNVSPVPSELEKVSVWAGLSSTSLESPSSLTARCTLVVRLRSKDRLWHGKVIMFYQGNDKLNPSYKRVLHGPRTHGTTMGPAAQKWNFRYLIYS